MNIPTSSGNRSGTGGNRYPLTNPGRSLDRFRTEGIAFRLSPFGNRSKPQRRPHENRSS